MCSMPLCPTPRTTSWRACWCQALGTPLIFPPSTPSSWLAPWRTWTRWSSRTASWPRSSSTPWFFTWPSCPPGLAGSPSQVRTSSLITILIIMIIIAFTIKILPRRQSQVCACRPARQSCGRSPSSCSTSRRSYSGPSRSHLQRAGQAGLREVPMGGLEERRLVCVRTRLDGQGGQQVTGGRDVSVLSNQVESKSFSCCKIQNIPGFSGPSSTT